MLNGEVQVPRHQLGFTYLGVLLLLALLGALMAGVGQRAAIVAQRERERELLFRGEQIRRAIESYHAVLLPGVATPATQWPQSLQDLLEDRRSGLAVHHLRRLYTDPFTGRADWVLLPAPGAKGGGGIAGVRSRAQGRRLLQALHSHGDAGAPGTTLADWQFRAADHGVVTTEDAAADAHSATRR